MNLKQEKQVLDRISESSIYAVGANAATINFSFRIFERFIRGKSILELGPAEGLMTERLVRLGVTVTVVEGSRRFAKDLHRRFPGITVVNALFEEFETENRFDNIVLGHVLEHVEDPVTILKRVAAWLAPGGRVIASVPNARSLHRQAATLMGLLQSEEQLNDTDRRHGHRRVFNPESFRNSFLQAGLLIEIFGGYWLKPLSNSQIEKTWTPEMLDAFMHLGERYPDIAGEIYVIASLPGSSS